MTRTRSQKGSDKDNLGREGMVWHRTPSHWGDRLKAGKNITCAIMRPRYSSITGFDKAAQHMIACFFEETEVTKNRENRLYGTGCFHCRT